MRALVLCAAALLLASCGIFSKAPSPSPGKYYADDGPPDKVPENLARIPDAEPRDEPFHRFANRPYSVFGQTYVPVVNKQPTRERGMASWYGRKFHGQKTASGEPYDMFAMTAAHKTLPIPSFARVTNVKTGQAVVVRVNDRGPFHSDRIIDLSYAAAARIGIVNAGSALVEVERIIPGPGVSDVATRPLPPPAPVAIVETPVIAREAAGLWLQLGAFSSAETAESFRTRMAKDLPWLLEPISIATREGLHRVRLGPYANAEEATAIGDKVRRSLGVAAVLTTR
ncbi:MAG: septal ring lytic transglycosylase RlpA family protein [Usitatibacter sp.]